MKVDLRIEMPLKQHIEYYSANGVPFPLDEWHSLQGRMTIHQASELAKKWPNHGKRSKERVEPT